MIRWKATAYWFWAGVGCMMLMLFVTPYFAGVGATRYGPFSPRIIDGDTLADGEMVFRLAGVDTCEMGQPVTFADHDGPLDCGEYAAAFVARFIGSSHVVCYDQGARTYGRIVARCFLDSGWPSMETDIGAFALRSGWAVPTDHSGLSFGLAYQFASARARIQQNGTWNGQLQNPADWRQEKR